MDSDRANLLDIAIRIHPVGPNALESLHLYGQFLSRPFSLNSFTKFPGLEAGAQLIIKDQLTVSAGCLYLDGIYANLRVGWLVK